MIPLGLPHQFVFLQLIRREATRRQPPTISALLLSNLCIDPKPTAPMPSQTSLLPGTLDLLILKTLTMGDLHGYSIAQHIKRLSEDVLRVEEGSLYPALQRMQVKGWITSESKPSPTGRTARYYKLTPEGLKQLGAEEEAFHKSVAATTRVLRGAES
jgi:PadR family transcriptional regulator, regulatory protein PadR